MNKKRTRKRKKKDTMKTYLVILSVMLIVINFSPTQSALSIDIKGMKEKELLKSGYIYF